MDGLEYLDSLGMFTMKPGLSRIRTLLRHLGDPQDCVPSILVSGTNGKGSTVHITRDVLKELGVSTLLYTSPHLISVTERISVDGQDINEGELSDHLGRVMEADRKLFPEGEGASYFEAITAAAFLCGRERNVDMLISEVGMGGRYDATNVLEPRAVGITSISLDHTEELGEDVASIAREKMGIMRPSTPCVIGPILGTDGEGIWALRKIIGTCSENGSPLIAIVKDENIETVRSVMNGKALPDYRIIRTRCSTSSDGTSVDVLVEGGGDEENSIQLLGLMDSILPGRFQVPLLGRHQGWNLLGGITLALLALPAAQAHKKVREGELDSLGDLVDGGVPGLDLLKDASKVRKTIQRGIENTRIPGRLELRHYGRGEMVLDGSHNMEAAEGLAAFMRDVFPGVRPHFLIAMMKDKSPAEFTSMLGGLEGEIFLTSIPGNRSMDMMKLLNGAVAGFGGDSNIHIRRDVEKAVKAWSRATEADGLGVSCGTFYLYEHIIKSLKDQF